jgi:hypothetical protein
MKSSAYLTRWARFALVLQRVKTAVASPGRALFASRGESTPPWGGPSSVGVTSIPSSTPAFSHPLTSRLISGVVLSFVSRAS